MGVVIEIAINLELDEKKMVEINLSFEQMPNHWIIFGKVFWIAGFIFPFPLFFA